MKTINAFSLKFWILFSFSNWSCQVDLRDQVRDAAPSSAPSGAPFGRLESRLSNEQRQSLIPNEVFSLVFNFRETSAPSFQALEEAIAKDRLLLLQTNQSFGETPLGMALRLGPSHAQLAQKLFEHYSYENLISFRNIRQETYLALAARAGNIALIEAMAARLRQRWTLVPEGLDPFDQPDALGRYAHFHARDLATFRVFERLHLAREVNPIRVSHHSVDHAGRTYLHWAAKENRTQVVAHTVVSRCQLPDSDGSNVDKFFQDVLNLIRTSGRFLALQVGDLRSFWALIVNRKDVMGRTALHWAAERQSLEALDELLKCGWLMPNQKDLQGNTALHLFLIALDPERPVHDSKTKETFLRLIRFTNAYGLRNHGQTQLILMTNQSLQTAAHLAARFRDPFFYIELQRISRVTSRDSEGKSPEHIRNETQRRAEIR